MTGEKRKSRRRRGRKRSLLTAGLLLLLSISSVGGTVAYIVTQTSLLQNTFNMAVIDCQVLEEYDAVQAKKTDVRVKNTGTADAYIRVKLIANWYANDSNTIVAQAGWSPTEAVKTGTGWVLGADGYYYYTQPVEAGDVTDNLIDSITLKMDEATRFRQVLEIIAEAIQAEGEDFSKGESASDRYPVVQAWSSGVSGIGADGKTLSIITSGGGS